MKKLLSLAFLIPAVALQLHAQQTTPAATKRATPAPTAKPSAPAAGKRSTQAAGRSSPAGAANLLMPLEDIPATPRAARPAAPETPRPRGNWEVYPADKMPSGKSLTEAEAAKLSSGDYTEKVLYLVGSFYVAVAHKDRAILQADDKPGPVRVVVSYPLSIPTPQEGSRMAREAPRGLRITKIKRVAADDVTIYVRDITLP